MNWDELGQVDAAKLFKNCKVKPEREAEVSRVARSILAGEARYSDLAEKINIPWYVIGAIHQMECGGDFKKHLHNGDPLLARTVHVPAGRPVAEPIRGAFPYTWEESATDALKDFPPKPPVWDIGHALIYFEAYNGLGYRKHGCPTPYVWSGTDVYTAGKFIQDGSFDPAAVSDQVGIAAILKLLTDWTILSFD